MGLVENYYQSKKLKKEPATAFTVSGNTTHIKRPRPSGIKKEASKPLDNQLTMKAFL